MPRVVFALAAATLLATVTLPAQSRQHHHPVYVMGGADLGITFTYPRGLFLFDKSGATPTLRPFTSVPYNIVGQHSVRMDFDNRRLIALTRGVSTSLSTWSGCLARFDPAAKAWTRLHAFPRSGTAYPQNNFFETASGPFVDQDGDYLLLHFRDQSQYSPTTVRKLTHRLLRYDRVTGALSTLLTTIQLPVPKYSGFSRLGRDIGSGRLMLGGWQTATPHTWTFPIWTLDPERAYAATGLGHWNYGTSGGWPEAVSHMEQNVRTGRMEGPAETVSKIHALRSGPGPLTTIATVTGVPFARPQQRGARFDLQTAAHPRMLLGCYYYTIGAWLLDYDVTTWKLTTFDRVATTPQYRYTYLQWQDFYRGRHIQTVRTAKDRWDIRLSCPHFAGKAYALAASLSGARPGVPLADGRRINLWPDAVTQATLAGQLPGVWSAGPGILDKNGEAVGRLDVSAFKRPSRGWGVPIWIAMAVLDQAAPQGVAYLPDTYVMRL